MAPFYFAGFGNLFFCLFQSVFLLFYCLDFDVHLCDLFTVLHMLFFIILSYYLSFPILLAFCVLSLLFIFLH